MSIFLLQLFFTIDKKFDLKEFNLFEQPLFAVSDAEHYCLVDAKSSEIIFLDRGGELLFRENRKGRGPGEFQKVSLVRWSNAGKRFLVFDADLQKLSLWSEKGAFLRDIRLNFSSHPRYAPGFFDEKRVLFVDQNQHLSMADIEKGQERNLPGLSKMNPSKKASSHGMTFYYQWDTTLFLRANARLAICNQTGTNQISVIRFDGKQTLSFQVPLKTRPVSEGDIEACLESLPQSYRSQIKKELKIPDRWPLVRNLFLDGNDRIWIFGQGSKKQIPYWTYTSEGRKIGRGVVEDMPQAIKNGAFYRIACEQDGCLLIKELPEP